MSTTTTTEMLLVLPDVGVQVGPTWATNIVAALTRIDAHDHTSDNGVAIPTAGISINANLTFNSYGATSLAFCGFTDQVSDPATLRTVYTKSGELYYQDSSSNVVQLTSGGAVNVSDAITAYQVISTYPYNILTTDTNKVLGIDTASGRTVTLPAATNVMVVFIKDVVGSAQTNNITVARTGSDTIDGGSSYTIDTDYGMVGFISDGTSAWYAI